MRTGFHLATLFLSLYIQHMFQYFLNTSRTYECISMFLTPRKRNIIERFLCE